MGKPRRARPIPARAARRELSELAEQLRFDELDDALERPKVDRAIEAAAKGPEPMDLPWPLASRDWTGKEIRR